MLALCLCVYTCASAELLTWRRGWDANAPDKSQASIHGRRRSFYQYRAQLVLHEEGGVRQTHLSITTRQPDELVSGRPPGKNRRELSHPGRRVSGVQPGLPGRAATRPEVRSSRQAIRRWASPPCDPARALVAARLRTSTFSD